MNKISIHNLLTNGYNCSIMKNTVAAVAEPADARDFGKERTVWKRLCGCCQIRRIPIPQVKNGQRRAKPSETEGVETIRQPPKLICEIGMAKT